MARDTRCAKGIIAVLLLFLLLVSTHGVVAQDTEKPATPADKPATPAPEAAAKPDKPATGPSKIAIVDLDAVSEDYQELIPKQNELREWAQARSMHIERLKNYTFLSQKDFDEVAELLKTPPAKWTEAQRNREEELRKVSDQKEKLFLDLQAKTDRTAEESDQFNSLAETRDGRRADIARRAVEIEKEYIGKRADVQGELVNSVRDIIIEVAEDQNYDLVLDSAMVFYSSSRVADLTQTIIDRLNKPAGG